MFCYLTIEIPFSPDGFSELVREMAAPKRKYSFGLISRLALIGAFVGLGSWAVFNSKFKQDDTEQLAENTSVGESEPASPADDNAGADSSGETSPPTDAASGDPLKAQAQPAAFLQQTEPPRIDVDNKKKSAEAKEKSAAAPPSSFNLGDSGKSGKTGEGGSKKSTPPKSTPPKSSPGQFLADKKDEPPSNPPPKKDEPPSSSFSPAAKSGSASAFIKPSADQKPEKSSAPAKSSGFQPGGQASSAPPSASFNPGGPPSSGSFSLASQSKSDDQPAADKKPPSAPPSAPPSSFNAGQSNGFSPSTNGAGSPGAGSPSSFQPPGSSESPSPAKTPPPSSLSDSRPPSRPPAADFAGNPVGRSDQGSGNDGFQARSSAGNERPLRGSAPESGNDGGSAAGSTFSLSRSDLKQDPKPAASNSPPQPGGFNPAPVESNRSAPVFNGGNAFQDKGSKPLPKNDPPPASGLNRSGSSSGIGSSSTGFGDIGRPPTSAGDSPSNAKQPDSASTDLDPKKLNSDPAGSVPGQSPGRANPGQRDGLGGDAESSPPRSSFASQPGGSSPTPQLPSHPSLQGNAQTGVDDRQPGPSSLEGAQTPAVTLQKIAPREIQVDAEAEFQILVRNVGSTTANHLTIVDPIPAGTEFVNADPPPTERGTDGSLIWKIGALAPNQQQIFNVRLLPKKQGEIGSIARISFQAAATAKSVCTKPEISITHEGPQKVLKGQTARFLVTVQNNGDGIARDVVIEDEVPIGFAFGDGRGRKLAYEVGNLPPGARREVQLNLRAVEPGRYVNEIRARMGKVTAANHKLDVEIVTPKLKMEIVGPTRRYIQREARYEIEVENTGTAAAKNVLMVTRLPKGLKFLRTNNRGQYNPREHAVYWSMVELTPQNKGAVELVLLPIGTGQQEIEFEAKSLLDRTELQKFPVVVDQLAELFFEVDDRDDPIEVNGETEYRIRVVNQGSKAATQVTVNVEMPPGIQAVEAKGPSEGTTAGPKVTFAPIPALAPRGELIYRIRAKGVQDGNHLIKVLLSSAERQEAVAKQESTKVYSEYR